jgi:hypothetical protein
VLVAIAILSLAGALPVRMLAGWRPATVFAAPIGGAILAGVAGVLTVLVNGTVLGWFVPLAVAANAAGAASWLARREARRSRAFARPGAWLWIAGGAGVLGVAGASAWSLRSASDVAIGSEARNVVLVHATWMANGHRFALAALKNGSLGASHSSYPPLGGAAVALGWVITGVDSARAGQIVLAILTGCAVAAAGATVLEAGLLASVNAFGGRSLLTKLAVTLVAAAAGAAFVLGAFGLGAVSATNGSVDLLWSAAAVAAAGTGLFLPLGGEHARGAAVFAVAAGLTSDQGILAAVLIFVLVAVRWMAASAPRFITESWHVSRTRGLVAVVACAVGVAGVGAWPVGAAVRRATSDGDFTGTRVGSFVSRTDATWTYMSGRLYLAGLALAVGVVAALVLGRVRRHIGFGADAWVWALGVAELVVVGAVYVAGTRQVDAWLASSVTGSTLFADCLGLSMFAWWCVVGTAAALRPGRAADRQSGVDAAGGGVLHQDT